MLESFAGAAVYLSRLSLTSYRNFKSLELGLPPGLVLILGDNAQGKSNLLEAAYLLAIARSYRTNVERELVHWSAQRPADSLGLEAPQTIIHGEVEQQGGRLRIIVGLRVLSETGAGGALVEKQIRVNGVPTTAAGLVGRVNAALFAATDIELVYGSPAQRRRFLDILISQVDRAYLRTLQRYQRVLTQRNHLLRLVREGRGAPQEIDFWDGELAKEGEALATRRDQVVQQLAPLVVQAYRQLAMREDLTVEYQPSAAAEDLASALARHRGEEVRAGMTLVGPHRDDLSIAVDGVAAATYASRGQARTIAVALRLAEAAFLRTQRREEPILLLDDVLSELDPQRRQRVLEEVSNYQQAVITLAEPLLVHEMPQKPSAVFTLRDGRADPWSPA